LRCAFLFFATFLAKRRLCSGSTRSSTAFAACSNVQPFANLSSFTRRSWAVPTKRSTRPFAWWLWSRADGIACKDASLFVAT
jgi:hypothetical protein